MSNGITPLDLMPDDYDTIKTGSCVTSGSYLGCIQVGSTYYWVSRGSNAWKLNKGQPDSSQVVITEDLWDKCKDGGTYTYNSTKKGWYDSQQTLYKWNGSAGGKMRLDAV